MELVARWVLRQAIGYRSATIYRLDLEANRALEGTPGFEWTFEDARTVETELWRVADINSSQQTEPVGSRCFVGKLNDRQCYLSLVSTTGFGIPQRVNVSFSGGSDGKEAYVGNCTTLETHRGMGIYPRGLAELGVELRAEGYAFLYLYVENENIASIRGVKKAGFYPVAKCSVSRWPGRVKHGWKILPTLTAEDTIHTWRVQGGD